MSAANNRVRIALCFLGMGGLVAAVVYSFRVSALTVILTAIGAGCLGAAVYAWRLARRALSLNEPAPHTHGVSMKMTQGGSGAAGAEQATSCEKSDPASGPPQSGGDDEASKAKP